MDGHNRLAEERQRRGLTQWELARQVGIQPSQISRYERGQAVPRIDAVRSLAAVFGAGIGDIYDWLETPAKDGAA